MPVIAPGDPHHAVPPPGLVLRSQQEADRLLEALWRARVDRKVAFKRSRWWSRNYARVPE